MEILTEEEFYKDYELNYKDESVKDLAHIFYETMNKSLADNHSLREVFPVCVSTLKVFLKKPEDFRAQFESMSIDFLYCWRSAVQNQMDKLYMSLLLAKIGDDGQYEIISSLCSDAIEAILLADIPYLWELSATDLFNMSQEFITNAKGPYSMLALLTIFMARLSHLCSGHSDDREKALLSTGLKFHVQAREDKSAKHRNELYEKIMSDAKSRLDNL